MKNALKLLGVITIAAALMFALVSCSDGSGGKDLVSITVTPPTKTLYNIGDKTLDTSDMKITATYSDGSTETVSISAVNISGFDSSTAGIKTITVRYKGKSVFFTVTVIDPNTAATPTATPPAGTFTTAQSVTLTTATTGAAIYYTTDGTNPTTASTLYSAAINISATTTLKAIAVKDGINNSALLTAVYTINDPSLETAATPTASPAAGTFTAAQSVTLSTATPGAAIYYTLNETDPTTESTLYSDAISISATTTVKAIAVKDGMNNSALLTAVYTISEGSGGSTDTFASIAAFKTWLDAQPANTAATAYNVKLNVDDLGGNYDTTGSLGNALDTNKTKYVYLDLSDSTITTIPEYAFSWCTSITIITIPDSVTSKV